MLSRHLPYRMRHVSKHTPCPLLCVVGGGLTATISQSSSATVPNRWPAATRQAGFYGAPRRSHLSCDHLCLPPAIGQGSYNSRVGGPGPQRTVLQLSRCGEGTGRGSATVEERPNEVPGDGPMNHYQLGYGAFKPKMHISIITFKTLQENPAAVKAAHCGLSSIFSLDYYLARRSCGIS